MHHNETIEKSAPKPKSPISEVPKEPKRQPPKVSQREQNYDAFIARKPLRNGPVNSGQAFFNEFTKIVKSPKFEVLKTDIGDALQFFDFMTKKKLLLVYCRHLKRLSMFKETNESSLFGNQRIVELINKYCAFTGFDEPTSPFPMELRKLNIAANDFPCLLIFNIDSSDRPTFLYKFGLKEVGNVIEELELIGQLEKVVGRAFNIKDGIHAEDKNPRLTKTGTQRGMEEEAVEEHGSKDVLKNGPFVARNVRQADLMKRLQEPSQKQGGIDSKLGVLRKRILDGDTKASHSEKPEPEEQPRVKRYNPKPVKQSEPAPAPEPTAYQNEPVRPPAPINPRIHHDRQ